MIQIPDDVDRDDMDVVIDGQRFVAESRAQSRLDAVADALAAAKADKDRLYRELHVATGNLEDERVLRAVAEVAADELQNKLDAVAGIVGYPRQEPVLEADDVTWTAVSPLGENVKLYTDDGTYLLNEKGDYYVVEPGKRLGYGGDMLADPEPPLPPEAVEHVKEVIVADEYNEAYFDEPVNGSRRRPRGWERWTRGLWIGIIALCTGGALGAATAQDGPTVVDTIQNVRPQEALATARQNLTWAPSEGADSYIVMIFRGGSLVQEKTVPGTSFEVDLVAGSYQWVVYPLRGGSRSEAIVNSILEVS